MKNKKDSFSTISKEDNISINNKVNKAKYLQKKNNKITKLVSKNKSDVVKSLLESPIKLVSNIKSNKVCFKEKCIYFFTNFVIDIIQKTNYSVKIKKRRNADLCFSRKSSIATNKKKNNNISDKLALIIKVLSNPPKLRTLEDKKFIRNYLLSLQTFVKFLSNIKEDKETTLEMICSYLKHKSSSKNSILFKYGDRGENYYIIISGKVEILLPKPYSTYLTREEYLKYLVKLITNNEIELYKNILSLNNFVYELSKKELDILSNYEEYINKECFVKKSFCNNKFSEIDLSNKNVVDYNSNSNYNINSLNNKDPLVYNKLKDNEEQNFVKSKKMSILDIKTTNLSNKGNVWNNIDKLSKCSIKNINSTKLKSNIFNFKSIVKTTSNDYNLDKNKLSDEIKQQNSSNIFNFYPINPSQEIQNNINKISNNIPLRKNIDNNKSINDALVSSNNNKVYNYRKSVEFVKHVNNNSTINVSFASVDNLTKKKFNISPDKLTKNKQSSIINKGEYTNMLVKKNLSNYSISNASNISDYSCEKKKNNLKQNNNNSSCIRNKISNKILKKHKFKEVSKTTYINRCLPDEDSTLLENEDNYYNNSIRKNSIFNNRSPTKKTTINSLINFKLLLNEKVKEVEEDLILVSKAENLLSSVSKEVSLLKYHPIVSLGPGNTFGEVALLSEFNKRSATCIITEDSEFGILSKDIYNRCIRKADMISYKKTIQILTNNLIFNDFSKNIIKKYLLNILTVKKICKNTVIIQENSRMTENKIYIVKSGTFCVYKKNASCLKLRNYASYLINLIDFIFKNNKFLYKYFDRSKLCLNNNITTKSILDVNVIPLIKENFNREINLNLRKNSVVMSSNKKSLENVLIYDNSTNNLYTDNLVFKSDSDKNNNATSNSIINNYQPPPHTSINRLYNNFIEYVKQISKDSIFCTDPEKDFDFSINKVKMITKPFHFELFKYESEGIFGLFDIMEMYIASKDIYNINTTSNKNSIDYLFSSIETFNKYIGFKSMFSIECVSAEGELYEIDMKNFMQFIEINKELYLPLINFLINKSKIIIDRINKSIDKKLEFIKSNNKSSKKQIIYNKKNTNNLQSISTDFNNNKLTDLNENEHNSNIGYSTINNKKIKFKNNFNIDKIKLGSNLNNKYSLNTKSLNYNVSTANLDKNNDNNKNTNTKICPIYNTDKSIVNYYDANNLTNKYNNQIIFKGSEKSIDYNNKLKEDFDKQKQFINEKLNSNSIAFNNKYICDKLNNKEFSIHKNNIKDIDIRSLFKSNTESNYNINCKNSISKTKKKLIDDIINNKLSLIKLKDYSEYNKIINKVTANSNFSLSNFDKHTNMLKNKFETNDSKNNSCLYNTNIIACNKSNNNEIKKLCINKNYNNTVNINKINKKLINSYSHIDFSKIIVNKTESKYNSIANKKLANNCQYLITNYMDNYKNKINYNNKNIFSIKYINQQYDNYLEIYKQLIQNKNYVKHSKSNSLA